MKRPKNLIETSIWIQILDFIDPASTKSLSSARILRSLDCSNPHCSDGGGGVV